jgi:beta-N-acetylhexosaminidase
VSVSELAAGIVMSGIAGTRFDPEIPRFGGYVLFPGDDAALSDVRALADCLRAHCGHPAPVIAIDQEGGTVARLRRGVEPIPSMMALAAADDIDLVARAGEQIAFDLRRAGCTLDFAPVLDLALEPQNTVIGTRSFGSDPNRVASLGARFARGMRDAGVLPCYKHFPGHGATATDSHEALPIIDDDAPALRSRDLIPFKAIAARAPAMMSAHVLARAIDADRPATLSRRILVHLLRSELGFRGTLITDCLEMEAVAGRGSEGAVEALAAGADLLLFSHDSGLARNAVAAIEAAVIDGRVPLSRLEEAHERVITLRGLGAAPLALDTFPPHRGVGREIGRRAITLVRGVPHADPVASVAVSFGARLPELEREAAALDELVLSIDPEAGETDALFQMLARRERRPLVLMRRAHRYPGQAMAVGRILDAYPDALVVSLREPYDVGLFPAARHLIATYGDDAASIGGLADVIFGGTMPTGALPVPAP